MSGPAKTLIPPSISCSPHKTRSVSHMPWAVVPQDSCFLEIRCPNWYEDKLHNAEAGRRMTSLPINPAALIEDKVGPCLLPREDSWIPARLKAVNKRRSREIAYNQRNVLSLLPQTIRSNVMTLLYQGAVSDGAIWSCQQGNYGQPQVTGVAPITREFMKMTSAEKRAHLSPSNMNRIASGAISSPELYNVPSRAATPSSRQQIEPMSLEQFKRFCMSVASSHDLHLELWQVETLPVAPTQVSSLCGHVGNLLSVSHHEMVSKLAILGNLTNDLQQYDFLIHAIRNICRNWETAMRQLPHFVRSIRVNGVLPPCSVALRREVEVSLDRMCALAKNKAKGNLDWHTQLTWNHQIIQTAASAGRFETRQKRIR